MSSWDGDGSLLMELRSLVTIGAAAPRNLVHIAATLWAGKLLSISLAQRLLIASGFAICGAAAVVATESPTTARKEEVATAIGLVLSLERL